MNKTVTKFLTIFLVALLVPAFAAAQSNGDYRSSGSGDWSDVAIWQTFDGSAWVAASSAPAGTDNVTIWSADTVTVDLDATITGYITVEDEAVLEVGETFTLTFGDGGTYEHARDEGEIPDATWDTNSTIMITGSVNDSPDNAGQDYYNLVLNTPDLLSNEDLDLGGHTISGDITVIDSGARWRLTGGSGVDILTINIMGDLIVQGGSIETLGTGSPTSVTVNHYGDVNVTGGAFSVSRGSQGSGTGFTHWILHEGDFTLSNAETENSNPDNAKFIFASNGTQTITLENPDYDGTSVNFEVSDSTTLNVGDGATDEDFLVEGTLTNKGEITTTGTLVIGGDGVYDHARDGGSVPDATWSEGSTFMLTGTVNDAPDNRGQDYWNVVLNTPAMSSNQDLDLVGATIGGDIHAMNSGDARWRLVGGDDATITINGDVIVDEEASLETMGSGSVVDVVVNHYGSIYANGGTFAITRGSQGNGTPEGTGSTIWYLHEGDFHIDSAQTRNSISLQGNAKFVFSSDTVQTLTIGENADLDQLPIEVVSGATLDLNTSILRGDDIFVVQDGGIVATQNATGLSPHFGGDVQVTFGTGAGVIFNCIVEQTTNIQPVADSLGAIWADNTEGGVVFNDSVYTTKFYVEEGVTATVDSGAYVLNGGGYVSGILINKGSVETDEDSTIAFTEGATYEHAVDGGVIPNGTWAEGSLLLITGTEFEGPDGGDQDFWNITFNTPDNVNNNYLGMVDQTVWGDIHTISTGAGRWYISGGIDVGDSSRVDVMGNIIHESGNFSAQGTGTANTHYEVYVHGDITVTGGNFSVSRGSQGNGTGSTNWYLMGDLSMTDATCQNSNSDNANWVFVNTEEPSLLTLNNVEINGSGMQIIVADSALLDLGLSEIDSGGNFTTNEGSTIYTANEGGLDSTLQMSGLLTLSTDGNYGFNGEVEQETSFRLPLVVHGLIIDNPAGVVQSRTITISGFLELADGVFDNTIGLNIMEGAEIIVGNGSLLIPIGGVELPIPTPPYDFDDVINYNGSFSEQDLGDAEADAWTINAASTSTVEVVDDSQDGDSRALSLTVAWDGSDQWYPTEAVNEPINVVEGEFYEVSVWLKADSEDRQAQVYLGTPEAGGYSRARGFPTPTTDLTTEWQEVTFRHQVTAEEAEVGMRVGVEVNAESNDGGTIFIDNATVTKVSSTGIEGPAEIPETFGLYQNYPNPFNPSTSIKYDVAEQANVTLKVYDITGREVAELVNGAQSPGTYTVNWNAAGMATGMYIYRITAGEYTAVKKLTLIK